MAENNLVHSLLVTSAIEALEHELLSSVNTANAAGMEKYMKDHFPFLGVKSPERKVIQKQWMSSLPKTIEHHERWELIDALWKNNEREFQYVAIDYLNSWPTRWIDLEDGTKLEKLITTKAWWDSVDGIAANFLGKFIKKFPDKGKDLVEKWRNDPNMWLKRSCLIYQLKYKDTTDFLLLKELIIQFLPIKEFFIQKAIGWSLRQHSKFRPEEVRVFIHEINLKGLARKEASKYL